MAPVPTGCPAQHDPWRAIGITIVVLFALLIATGVAVFVRYGVVGGKRHPAACRDHERILRLALDDRRAAIAESRGHRATLSLYKVRHARLLAELEGLRAERLERGYELEGLRQQLEMARDVERPARLKRLFGVAEAAGEPSPASLDMRVEEASPFRVVGKGKATLVTQERGDRRLSVSPVLGECSTGAPREPVQSGLGALDEEEDDEPFHPDVLAFLSVCLPPGERAPPHSDPTPVFVVGDDVSEASSDCEQQRPTEPYYAQ